MDKTQGRMRILNMNLCNQRGQSLLLALLVMFLLVFVAGLFVALIARNVGRAHRSGEVLSTDYLAEAGIRYANDQFTYGEDGADWRPAPSYPGVLMVPQGADLPDHRDPDYSWLMQGFSRYNYGKGRFLIRATYDPRPDDPISKFIKVESIGRIGEVDPNDPTTFHLNQPMRARREKVLYKAIAITDYVRFVTNKDRRPGEISLGTPDFITHFGERTDESGSLHPHGGSIRVNGDLLWHGENHIWLDPLRGEGVEVAGDIRHGVYSPASPVPDDTTVVEVNGFGAKPSSSPDFSTIPLPRPDGSLPVVGSYRDGRMALDLSDPNVPRPRSIFRIEPPLLDAKGPASRLGRYREITRNSGEWRLADDPLEPDNPARQWWYNTGYYGWGEGLYINNQHDIQEETPVYTLRGDWTNPGASEYWRGPYYTPPAVSIILTPYDLDNDDGDNDAATGEPDMILTHSGAPGAPKFNWYDEDGNVLSATGEQILMSYPKNGVIFAEGNIRIKGMLPPDVQLTVVSGATIYVEGNILKYRTGSPGVEPSPRSAIALLAADNICVNTTQFFGPVRGVFVPGSEGSEAAHFEVGPGSEGIFWFDFAFGDYLAKYGETPISMYVRHASDRDVAGDAYMNMLVNFPSPNPTDEWTGVYDFGALSYVYPVRAKDPLWEHQVFGLWPNPSGALGDYDFNPAPGVFNRIGFQFDEALADPNQPITKVNYLLSRVAIQPSDITIEALMYAQNGSFFVIPGEWFNPDTNDTNAKSRPACIANEAWPLYGQPLDVQIVIRGAVSENLPASVADARAWMDKWGWIPPVHGNSKLAEDDTTLYRELLDPGDPMDPTDDLQRGLTFVYDSRLSCPRVDPTNPASPPIRMDRYGRLLPITPRLPVSPQMLYFGEPT